MSLTSITVEGDQARWTLGPLRPMRLADRDGFVRLSLLASTALLLGGDAVELRIVVADGARLELTDVAGTVAYHGRGRSASWRIVVDVGAGAEFRYAAEPFVVADGAEVERDLQLTVADTATVRVIETLALGRTGERGGRLRSRTRLEVGGRLIWLEDQLLDPDGVRGRPGMLGAARMIETTIAVGQRQPAGPEGATRFTLLDGAGVVDRILR